MIDPISDVERTILKLDPVPFAVGKKGYDVLIDECHVPQIEHQRLPMRLEDEDLSELLNILRLHPAAECEYHLTVC